MINTSQLPTFPRLAPASHPVADATMSDANRYALASLKGELLLNIPFDTALTYRLETPAGGFLSRREALSVTEQATQTGRLEHFLNILGQKGDSAFITFLEMLRAGNCGSWALELEKQAQKFALSSPAIVPGSATLPDAQEPTAIASSMASNCDHQSQLSKLQADLEAAQSYVRHVEDYARHLERARVEQDHQIEEFARRLREKDEIITKQAARIAGLEKQPTAYGDFSGKYVADLEEETSDSCGFYGQPCMEHAQAALLGMKRHKDMAPWRRALSLLSFLRESLKSDHSLQEKIEQVAGDMRTCKVFNQYEYSKATESSIDVTTRTGKVLDLFAEKVPGQDYKPTGETNVKRWTVLLESLDTHGCTRAFSALVEGLCRVQAGESPAKEWVTELFG